MKEQTPYQKKILDIIKTDSTEEVSCGIEENQILATEALCDVAEGNLYIVGLRLSKSVFGDEIVLKALKRASERGVEVCVFISTEKLDVETEEVLSLFASVFDHKLITRDISEKEGQISAIFTLRGDKIAYWIREDPNRDRAVLCFNAPNAISLKSYKRIFEKHGRCIKTPET